MTMGSDLASSTTPTAALPLRRLWQAPMFFVGLVTLLAGSGLHVWRSHACPCGGHDLARARCLLDRDHNASEAASLLQRVIEHAPAGGDAPGEAYLLLGWAHAELSRGMSAEAASRHWAQAREYLEKAEM